MSAVRTAVQVLDRHIKARVLESPQSVSSLYFEISLNHTATLQGVCVCVTALYINVSNYIISCN
jgi:hypothetical protein